MVAVERDVPAPGTPASADAIPLTLRRRGGTPRQVLAIVLIGTLVLAVFASRDLSAWLNRMNDGPGIARLQHAAAAWDGAMGRIGLVAPFVLLRDSVQRLRDLEWPSEHD
ncbi:MAG TPA: hypothetical protein VJR70_05710 [Stellaceae bacterium]|nr:hypothetical protein [Stellaceae bacterium]